MALKFWKYSKFLHLAWWCVRYFLASEELVILFLVFYLYPYTHMHWLWKKRKKEDRKGFRNFCMAFSKLTDFAQARKYDKWWWQCQLSWVLAGKWKNFLLFFTSLFHSPLPFDITTRRFRQSDFKVDHFWQRICINKS